MSSTPLFVTGRRHRPVLNAIGRTLIGAILFNALSPLSVLANDKPVPNPAAQRQLQQYAALNQKIEQAKTERALTPADRVSKDFQQAHDLVRSIAADAKPAERSGRQLRAVGPDMRIEVEEAADLRRQREQRVAEQTERLRSHLTAISQSRAAVRADFTSTGRELQAKKLSAEILARHAEAVAQFEQRAAEFERLSQAWQAAADDAKPAALADLNDFFKRYPATRTAAPLDPKKLPWRAPEPTTRQPADTQTAWFQNLWGTPKVMLAQAGGSVGPVNFNVPPEPGQAPTVADLAETPETQRSTAITAKAAELGNNPLAIHNWVRNNLDWLPSWGAVQSADDTLAKKRGNAHDIASLEIALLRAANIPARYQYGTIDVDADKLQNWVGGTTKVEAAQQLLGQGGIANRGLLIGGGIGKVRMEHVWVSAYVNWLPSRGAKQGAPAQHVNPNGTLNAWVPLDPSYKQYSYTAGLDLKTAVPLDPQALINAAQRGATVNASEGWVQNLNQAAVQAQLNDYQARLKTYIDGQNTNATVGDVIGKKIIPQQLPSLLAGSLPYAVVQTGQRTSAVPANLQHQFRIQLFNTQDAGFDDPTAVLSYKEKTSQLAGKRLTISYMPATQADADLIASYLPKPHADGSPIQPSEFSSSLPGYLIRLKPQINLDGQVVAQASQALTMGTDLFSSAGFTRFSNPTDWDISTAESHAVGQMTAVGLSIQGIGASQINQLKSRLDNTKVQLEGNSIAGLTGEQIAGDLLLATIWNWFVASEGHSKASQAQANVVENSGLSYGFFNAVAQPIYSWGVARQVKFLGVNIDVPHQRSLSVSKSAVVAEWAGFNRHRGQYMSGLEASVPERLFNDPTVCNLNSSNNKVEGLPVCPQGVSAMRALGLAALQGQRIYTITAQTYSNNPGVVQSHLTAHSFDTRVRVQNALDAGYEVVVHEKPIAQDGWIGAGFAVIDPQTGAGGYLIEGGLNGGVLSALVPILQYMGYFYDLLEKVALKAGSVVPLLGRIAQMLQLAKMVADLLDRGTKCSNFGAIASYIAITTILGMLAVELALMFAAPMTSFFVGVAFDAFFDWLLAEASEPGGQCN